MREAAIAQTAKLLDKFASLLRDPKAIAETSGGLWLFGFRNPSALDAHLITFLARLRDIGLRDIIPVSLDRYASEAMETVQWKGVMQGRTTVGPAVEGIDRRD